MFEQLDSARPRSEKADVYIARNKAVVVAAVVALVIGLLGFAWGRSAPAKDLARYKGEAVALRAEKSRLTVANDALGNQVRDLRAENARLRRAAPGKKAAATRRRTR